MNGVVDHLSLVNDNIVLAVDEKIRENRRITVTSVSLQVPEIACSLLHEIECDRLRKCVHWVAKKLTEQHKIKWWDSALAFLI